MVLTSARTPSPLRYCRPSAARSHWGNWRSPPETCHPTPGPASPSRSRTRHGGSPTERRRGVVLNGDARDAIERRLGNVHYSRRPQNREAAVPDRNRRCCREGAVAGNREREGSAQTGIGGVVRAHLDVAVNRDVRVVHGGGSRRVGARSHLDHGRPVWSGVQRSGSLRIRGDQRAPRRCADARNRIEITRDLLDRHVPRRNRK
jgi:hypothetical protein